MAHIGLKNLRHSYLPNPVSDEDWALSTSTWIGMMVGLMRCWDLRGAVSPPC